MEKENEIIYDLTDPSLEPASDTPASDSPASDTAAEENADGHDDADTPESTENEKEKTPAETEIERMIQDVGADTLLEIIRDNRNAAIRQIISEVESSRQRMLPSGVSVAAECNSIFDLAALA